MRYLSQLPMGALLAVLVGCGHGGRPPRGSVERLPRLEVVRPQRVELKRVVELAATLRAMKEVDLTARVPGVVDYLPDRIDIGRKVKKDEVLLKLAVPELEADKKHKQALLEQARKQKVQAEEALTVARRQAEESQKREKQYEADLAYQRLRFERMRDLVRRGAQELQIQEEAEKQRDAAAAAYQAGMAQTATRQAMIRSALADLEVADRRIQVAEADVERLTAQIGFATIKAPFDGVITRRWIDPGATIKDPATPLLTLMQVDRMRLLMDIPQHDVPLVNARDENPNPNGQGDEVTVRIPALAEKVPNGEFTGYIVRIAKSVDPVTRTMRTEVELDNAAGHLRPGMYGTAKALLEKRSNVLTIPATALVRKGGGKVDVFHVARPEGKPLRGKLQRIEIDVGIDDGQVVEVRRGLNGDEWIVARGKGVMRVDDQVIAIPERPQP